MNATKYYFPVVLFIMLYKVILTVESVDEILKCDHSNESYWAVLSSGTVSYAVQGGSNFWVSGWNPKVWPFKWKLLSSTFLWYCLLCCARCGSNFWVCGWNPLNESYWAVLCCNAFVYALQDGSDFRVIRENPWVWPFIWKLPKSTFLWYCKVYT